MLEYLHQLGLRPGQHALLHGSLRAVRRAFPRCRAEEVLAALQRILTANGSLIMPTFTYCFKRVAGGVVPYEAATTPSKTGFLSEHFRQNPGVIRTASPTHAFALWGRVTEEVGADNSPTAPLGRGSVLEWLHARDTAVVVMLGVDFSALTFGHYLEHAAGLPGLRNFPWTHAGILPVGVSTTGEQPLEEVPGCSRSFIHLEKHLLEQQCLVPYEHAGLRSYLISVARLYEEGLAFLREHPDGLLCAAGTCQACDTRRQF
ncbi:MAG: AAC(3) family N-acetyltransferase [candidate division KSB1 bacterium]|nr:AAC(3) family N-acetyltransferase [candidate division KSB1 bacterium]